MKPRRPPIKILEKREKLVKPHLSSAELTKHIEGFENSIYISLNFYKELKKTKPKEAENHIKQLFISFKERLIMLGKNGPSLFGLNPNQIKALQIYFNNANKITSPEKMAEYMQDFIDKKSCGFKNPKTYN